MKWTEDEIKIGILLIINGKNFPEISKSLNRSIHSVTKKFNRLGYKVNNFRRESYCLKSSNKKKYFVSADYVNKFDWNNIQKEHDNGKSYRELIIIFKLTPQAIKWAKNNGKIKFRTQKEGIILSISKGLCKKSKKSGLERYRQLCEFKFKLKDYADKFDFSLISKYGWYKAKNRGNNLNGISRDHMYSVKEGYINNIDPEIIRHPANCKLMRHSENSKKKDKSSISLSMLLNRIKNW